MGPLKLRDFIRPFPYHQWTHDANHSYDLTKYFKNQSPELPMPADSKGNWNLNSFEMASKRQNISLYQTCLYTIWVYIHALKLLTCVLTNSTLLNYISYGYQNIDDRHRNPNINIREIIWMGNQPHFYISLKISGRSGRCRDNGNFD